MFRTYVLALPVTAAFMAGAAVAQETAEQPNIL